MALSQVYEGTWEEIAQRAEEFRGKRVRLVVISAAAPAGVEEQPPAATPEERA